MLRQASVFKLFICCLVMGGICPFLFSWDILAFSIDYLVIVVCRWLGTWRTLPGLKWKDLVFASTFQFLILEGSALDTLFILLCWRILQWFADSSLAFNCNNFGTLILLDSSFGSDHSERGELVRIAANRAEQLFPGGFRLRAHVGDTVRPHIWNLISLSFTFHE